jgi:NAD(P)-dependent dehydrogenase (short-subunit alcohol dehydrogenase family)
MSAVFDLTGRRAIVTGAAVGIGHGIAAALAGAGADVLLVDRDAAVQAAADALGDRARALVADVTAPDAAEAIVDACCDAFGGVDVLFNNAGRYPFAQLEDITDTLVDEVFGLNFVAALRVTQAAAARMGHGASIVNIGSVDAVRPSMVGLVVYGSSKGALIAATKHLALELAPRGIRVNAIIPGGIRTEGAEAMSAAGGMTEAERDGVFAAFDAKIPLGRMGLPDDLAGPAVFLAAPASAYVTGGVLLVDGGLLLTS